MGGASPPPNILAYIRPCLGSAELTTVVIIS